MENQKPKSIKEYVEGIVGEYDEKENNYVDEDGNYELFIPKECWGELETLKQILNKEGIKYTCDKAYTYKVLKFQY